MKLFKPAWQSKNETKALKKVSKITNQDTLLNIALNAPLAETCIAAVDKLTSLSDLNRVKQNISNFIPYSYKVAISAAKKLNDQNFIAEIVASECPDNISKDYYSRIQKKAFEDVTDQKALAYIVKNVNEFSKMALHKVADQNILADIVINIKGDYTGDISKKCLEKITDQNILADIAESKERERKKVAERFKWRCSYCGHDEYERILTYGDHDTWGLSCYKRCKKCNRTD